MHAVPLEIPAHSPAGVADARGAVRVLAAASLGVCLALSMGLTAAAADRDGDLLRDGFETRWGVSDPDRADSDGDGVIDSAEDSDGDRLSDLGEQRFKLDPGSRDTDRDGRPDSLEDHDGDGRSNLLEQDRRQVPSGLRPALWRAKRDYPERRFSCQTEQGQTRVIPCRFGTVDSPVNVAIFGDSHAAQWLPSFDRAGEVEGWRITQLTKSACPSISATVKGQWRYDGGRTCRRWRRNVYRWLRDHEPDVIVISNRSRWTLIDTDGRPVPIRERRAAWRRAMARTLASMPAASAVVVLSDTPRMFGEPVICLRQHKRDISACTTRRSKALSSWIRGAEREAAVAAGAATRNLNDVICTYDPCPLIHGRVLVWRDHGHLTATFNRMLWPTVRDRLRSAAQGALDA